MVVRFRYRVKKAGGAFLVERGAHDEPILDARDQGGEGRRTLAVDGPVARAERLAEVSKRVRGESMKVNAEFAAIERDRGA
jgi:hypothetical protein